MKQGLDSDIHPQTETAAQWLGINRATLAVLVIIGCLGLSEEIWASYLALHLANETASVLKAAQYVGVIAFAQNVLEGFGYIIGGSLAHRMGWHWRFRRFPWPSASPSCSAPIPRWASRSARCS